MALNLRNASHNSDHLEPSLSFREVVHPSANERLVLECPLTDKGVTEVFAEQQRRAQVLKDNALECLKSGRPVSTSTMLLCVNPRAGNISLWMDNIEPAAVQRMKTLNAAFWAVCEQHEIFKSQMTFDVDMQHNAITANARKSRVDKKCKK